VPPAQTNVIAVVTSGGNQANATIEWHADRIISSTEVLPACDDPTWNMDQSSYEAAGYVALALADPKSYVFYAVTATLSADFPVVNGFTWPSGESIDVDESAAARGGRLYCFPGEIKDGSPRISLTTAKPTSSAAWVTAVQKSPNNPTGLLPVKSETFGFDVSGPGACTSTGPGPIQGLADPTTTCYSTYSPIPRS